MKLIPMQGQVLDGTPVIQTCCRDARGQPCTGHPAMIGDADRHRRSHRAPRAQRIGIACVGFGGGNGSCPRWCGSTSGSEASDTHRGVFVHLHAPRCGTERIAFCQGAHGALENRPVGSQAVVRGSVAQGLMTPPSFAIGLRFPVAPTMLHHTPCFTGLPVALTMLVKAVQRLPVKQHHHGS